MASDAELGVTAASAPTDASPPPEKPTGQIMLPAGVFPEGIAPKAGDKLVLGEPGEDGSIPATLEAAPEVNKDEKERADWEEGFRRHMAPTMGGEEAQ